MENIDPRPGHWYRTPDHAIFRVVVTDPGQDAIEIQYPDGERERLDLETWAQLPLVALDPQEPVAGPPAAPEAIRPREWLGNEAASPFDRRFG